MGQLQESAPGGGNISSEPEENKLWGKKIWGVLAAFDCKKGPLWNSCALDEAI